MKHTWTNGNFMITITAPTRAQAEKKARSYFTTIREKQFFEKLTYALPNHPLPRQPLDHIGKTR